MNKIGLFFGSFNPVHIGHLAIANYMVEYTILDELWFVISPQNPLKKKSTLLADYHRLYLLELAIKDSPIFKISDIEFKMPRPSYTIHTLTYLKEKFPGKEFILIMGSDGLKSFHKWKNYENILDMHDVYVYPRNNESKVPIIKEKRISIVDAPKMEISSSFIRNAIKNGKDVRHFLNPDVYKYIVDMHFYKD